MKMHLIATIRDSKDDIVGFRILDSDNMQVIDQPRDKVANVLANGIAPIIGMEFRDGEVKGTNGSLARYPKLNQKLKPLSNEMVIIGQFYGGDSGYLVANIMGKTTTGSKEDLVAKAKQIGIANGKIVTNNFGDDFLSAINGKYEELDGEKFGIKKREITSIWAKDTFGTKEKQTQEQMNKDTDDALNKLQKLVNQQGIVHINRASMRRFIPGTPVLLSESHFKDVIDQVNGKDITAEDKLLSVMIGIKYLRPLYYCILTHMNRKETNDVPTMAVSANTLYFNTKYLQETPISILAFTVIHELTHVALQHVARMGKRNPDMWNYATDLYVNKLIYENFELNGLEITYLDIEGKKILNKDEHYKNYLSIAISQNFLFSDDVDTKKDTPESLYEILMQENKDNQDQNNDDQDQDNDDQDQNQNGDGSGGGDGNQQNNQNQQGNGGGDQGDEDSQGGDGSDGDGDGDGSESEDGDAQDSGESSGSSSGSDNGKGKSGKGQNKPKKIKFRGKEFDVSKDPISKDMVDDAESRGKSEEQVKQESRSLLSNAMQSLKQSNQYTKTGTNDLLRQIEMQLAPKINWKNLLKNYFIKASQTVNTFTAPDKRFRTRNMIIPGPKKLDNDLLDSVKICIDTSGSVGDREIGEIYTQTDALLKKYKADAEIIFWDTRVKSVSRLKEYKNARELIKVKPVGGGGTDPACVFEYFLHEKDYKIGKRPKPNLILMFTDGCFSTRDIEQYKSKFKGVIWIIHDNDKFEAPFGKVAPFEND